MSSNDNSFTALPKTSFSLLSLTSDSSIILSKPKDFLKDSCAALSSGKAVFNALSTKLLYSSKFRDEVSSVSMSLIAF